MQFLIIFSNGEGKIIMANETTYEGDFENDKLYN